MNTPQPDIDITPVDLDELARAGYRGLGTVAVLATVHADRILMFEHAPSQKIGDEPLWGPPSETAEQMSTGLVETPMETFWRGLRQELGTSVTLPRLQAPLAGRFLRCSWPLNSSGDHAYGIGIVLRFVDDEEAEQLVRRFQPTEEIMSIQLMSPTEIRHPDTKLRPGVLEWLQIVENNPLFAHPGPYTPVSPTRQRPFDDASDVIFAGVRR